MGIYSIPKLINENYFFSGDDIILNIKKWKANTPNNILYITGLSGSGKTTLAEEYQKKYNAEMFEIDDLEDYNSPGNSLVQKAKEKFPSYDTHFKNKFKDITNSELSELLREVLLYIIEEMKASKKLYILEGLQIFELLDPNTLKSKPMIIKGTSMTKSIYRRFKRNGNGKIDWIAELQDNFPQLFKWYMSDEKKLSELKKSVTENGEFILESSNSQRKWKCPYCDYRDTRERLVDHVDKLHEDMLSDEYPAARAVFNSINKKDHGSCVICNKETKWNNDTWRYDRRCGSPKCQKEYVKLMKSRMINKYGQEHLLNDPEKQKEMLSHRKISGTYKFADGGIRSYCGSYEKKLLEFYDKVMNAHSKDVITPGPIIEYEYNGKTLKWITDIYYVPANLVHDVKDGGDNPNNRQMDDYRAKQIAKEDTISKLNKYNYIRLTDNNFEQLLLILSEIKYQMVDDDKNNKDFIIRINESMVGAIGAALPNQNNQSDNGYIVPYMINNSFNIGLSTDKYFSNFYKIEDDKIKKGSIKDLYNTKYSIYKYNGNDFKEIYESILQDYNTQINVNKYYLYEKVCDKQLLSEDQLEFDENLKKDIDAYTGAVIDAQINEASLIHLANKNNNSVLYTKLTDELDIKIRNKKLSFNCDLDILQDLNGYFIYNEKTNRRSKSYDSISIIPYMDIIMEKL